jgi:hypothetical protein
VAVNCNEDRISSNPRSSVRRPTRFQTALGILQLCLPHQVGHLFQYPVVVTDRLQVGLNVPPRPVLLEVLEHVTFVLDGRGELGRGNSSKSMRSPEQVGRPRKSHRWRRPKRIRGSTWTLKFVQPPRVESDRAELLLGDLYAFSVRQLKPHTCPRNAVRGYPLVSAARRPCARV